MARAGEWLIRNDETHGFLSNHLAAAAGALRHAYRQTNEARFAERSQYFLDRILGRQSEEGWYDEYGGADPGYQTHCSFYMARCWELTEDELLRAETDLPVALTSEPLSATAVGAGQLLDRMAILQRVAAEPHTARTAHSTR